MLAIVAVIVVASSVAAKPKQKIEPSYSWTISDPLGTRYSADIDTSHIDYAQRFVPSWRSDAWATTGNYGAAGQNMIFFERNMNSDFFLADALKAWIPGHDRMQFYNTRIPMTILSYTTGGDQNSTQDHTQAIFSGNINRKSQVGGFIDYIYSKGSYDVQADKGFSWGLSGSHMGDRYEFQGYFRNFNYTLKENGGITDDRYITNPREVQGGDARVNNKSIPVLLNGAHSRVSGMQIMLNNRYKVGFYKYLRDSVTDTIISRTYVPVTSFIYNFSFRRNNHRFTNDNASQDYTFFPNSYLSYGSTDERTRQWALANTFGISMLEGFNKRVKFGFAAYIKHEMVRYYQVADTVTGSIYPHDNLTPLPFTVDSITTQHSLYVGGQLTKHLGSLITYDVNAEFGVAGANAGNIYVTGDVKTRFKLGRDSVKVRGYGHFINHNQNLLLEKFMSNHYVWNNNFSNTQRFRVGGELDVPLTGTNVNVGYETLKNFVYFNTDAVPDQHTSAIHVLSASVSQMLHFGPLYWNTRLTYQESSNSDVLPLPKFAVYSNLSFRFTVAKVLKVQLGVDGNYYTSYYAPNYNPATMTFYNQTEQKRGNFLYMNAFANFKLKRARFFVMYQHFNKGLFGGNDYFSIPHYPLNPGRFQFGVSVDFIN